MQILNNNKLMQIVRSYDPRTRATIPTEQLILKNKDEGAPAIKYKYFRLVIRKIINNIYDWGYCIQFSNLKFHTASGLMFSYSSDDSNIYTLSSEVGCTNYDQNGNSYSFASSNESGIHSLTMVGQKCVIKSESGDIPNLKDIPSQNDTITEDSMRLYVEYELNKGDLYSNPVLDVSIYNKWSFYTCGDRPSRLPYDFSLEVSNDRVNWRELDSCSTGPITTNSNSLAYEGTLKLN